MKIRFETDITWMDIQASILRILAIAAIIVTLLCLKDYFLL